MSQMVLPQNLSNSPSPEAAKASGSARPNAEKAGESPFDAVSRSERKRLDERKEAGEAKASTRAAEKQAAEKQEAEKQTAEKSDTENARPDALAADRKAEGASAKAEPPPAEPAAETIGQGLAADEAVTEPVAVALAPLLAAGAEPVGVPEELPATDPVPVTFANLQSLVLPAQAPVAAPGAATGPVMPANSQGLRFVQGAMAAQIPGQNGSAPGKALAESLLAGVTAEGGKGADSPLLQNAIRFQGALESVSAQANGVNAPKMAPDAPILRGYTTSIDLPVSHADWGDKVAGKLTWLTARNMSVAEIHLTPPDMGPMEVRVQVQQDQANISVHSANPVVREQLELHSHRLREMLNEQGFAMARFDVSDSGRDQPGGGETGGDQSSGQNAIANAELDEAGAELQSLDLTWKGEVDVFA